MAGATNDADYVTGLSFSLPDGAFVVAYGASHVATGKAAYTSVSLYADAVATVPFATKQSAELKGSARDSSTTSRTQASSMPGPSVALAAADRPGHT